MANFELNVKLNGIEQSVSSIGELEQALAATNKQLSQVEENSKEFKFLENQASNLEKVLGALTTDANNFNKSLKGVDNTTKQLNNSFNSTAQAAAEISTTGQSVRQLNKDVQDAALTSQSLRAELRQIVQELQTLEPGSARFVELSARAGQLRDQITDTNEVVSQLAGNMVERLTRGITNTVQIGVAGFQAIAGATALFGVESEALQQTMVKLTALLNLSQALETFGGLDQKIELIKASFTSLFPAAQSAATATSAAAVATTAEGVAATGAAGATTAFGVALNALPLVAIITALGLLVAGLINYASGADEAKKIEEERKKKLEEEKQAIDGVVESTAKEGTELITLLARLKATNAGSKERNQLLQEINSNYGVGLQNLKDETAFQNQATDAIKQYIQQLKNKVALQLVQGQIEKLAAKELANMRELEQLQGNITLGQTLYNKNLGAEFALKQQNLQIGGIYQDQILKTTQYVYDFNNSQNLQAKADLDRSTNRKKQLEAENKSLQDQMMNLGAEAQKYANLLTNVFEKTTGGINKTSTSVDDAAKKQEDALADLLDFAQKTNDEEISLFRERVQRTTSRIDDLEFERDITLSKIIQEYEAQKKAIENNVKDEKKRAAALEVLERDFLKRKETANTSTNEKIDELNKQNYLKQEKYIAELIKANQTLQSEITYGNNNTADLFETLSIRINDATIRQLDLQLKSNDISQKDFIEKQNQKLKLQQENADLQLAITQKQATAEASVQIQEIVNYYDEVGKYTITKDEETGKYKVAINAETLSQIKADDKDALDAAAKEAELVEGVINQSAVNLNAEANNKMLAADIEYDTNREQNATQTDQEIFNSRMKMAENLLFIFQQLNDALGEIEAGITAKQEAETARQNELFAAGQQQRADALEAAYQADIAANNYTEDQKKLKREQTDKAIRQIQENTNAAVDASNRKLAEKQFKRQKALNIVSALINGAQAVMQGIAQFGPPPSPMGIAAIALAGIITAAQVAAISAQRFDGGSTGMPTSVSTPEVSTSTPSVASSPMASMGGGFTSFTATATGAPTGAGSTFTPFESGMQKVYVVESDISAAQNRVRVLENNSTFG
jgi:hypothetical protein